MATLRQIAANRANSEKSTGPTTDAGKAASRRNALTHGLTGAGVVLPDEDADAVQARMVAWRDGFQPATVEDEWLFEQLVVSSVRVDRCQRHESELRTYEARRAILCWDEDRLADAEDTAAALSRNPSRVAARLNRTRQGADWLLDRWLGLGAAFEKAGSWTDAQHALALDMLGTAAELREGAPELDPPSAVVAREVARLEGLRTEALDGLDEIERESACDGLALTPSPALSRLRRYEAACMRLFHWARNLLRAHRTSAPPSPSPTTTTRFGLVPTAPVPSPQDWHAEEHAEKSGTLDRLADLQTPSVLPGIPKPEALSHSAPTPILTPVTPVNQTTPSLLPHGNRRARRAAMKLLARDR